MKIFHAKKGHFAPGKRALAKTWGPPWPPSGSYVFPAPPVRTVLQYSKFILYLDYLI